MNVEVSYYGQSRQAAGVGSERLTLEGAPSLADALKAAADAHGDALGKILFSSEGAISASVLVTVNDEVVTGTPPALADGDRITIVPPIAGG